MGNGASGSAQHPSRVSRFEILETLGEGAMGVVYRARDPMLERDVALKLIRPELAGEAKNRSRFLRECRAAATINHPGVATIYEAGETDDGLLYLASELVHGETLKEMVGRGKLPATEVIDIGIQLAEALQAAHDRGAIHRDIKPSNIMMGRDGRLKILDFGLARLVATDDDSDGGASSIDDRRTIDQTQAGAVVGTPAYMSPEQATAVKVDPRTDIFSAGCVLYELLTGVSPFRSGSVSETLRRVLCEQPPSIGGSADRVSTGLDEVLRNAMRKNREARTATAAELADRLRTLVEDRVGDDVDGDALLARGRRKKAILGAVTGAAAMAVAAMLIWQWSRPTLAFTDHDRVMIADVENLTGDEAFDLALRTALETDLKQSPYAKLYRRHQVEETLRLMRKSSGAVVDEALGRDVCRFSGVRALVLPRIVPVGDGFELQAAVVDPQTGRHVEQIRVSADDRDDVLLDAIDELTRELRTRLGESLESIEKNDFPIAQVTTSSWEALHYFALGSEEWGRGDQQSGVELYELALELDPAFATCRGSLGLLLIQWNIDVERGREELRRALADAETLPRDEYLMLRAAKRQFVDHDLEGALEEYEMVSDLYPTLMAPYNNRGRILAALGRFDEAVEMFERSSELDPHSVFPLVNLAFLFAIDYPDAEAAEEVARKLVQLDPDVPNYHSFLGWALAVQLRFDEAAAELAMTLEAEPDHPFALPNMGYVMVAGGNPASAILYLRRNLARISNSESEVGRRGAMVDLAVALSLAGETEQARRLASEAEEEIGPDVRTLADHAFLAQMLGASGQLERAERHLAAARSVEVTDAEEAMAVAIACALLGRRECAVEGTRQALDTGFHDPYLPMLLPGLHSLLGDPEFMALFEYPKQDRPGE